MPYNIALDKEHNIVCVRVYGIATKEEHLAARDESIRFCKEEGWSLLLIDLKDLDTSSVSTAGCFSFGKEIAAVPVMRFAHVLPRDLKSRSDVKFTTTVALNRGKMVGEFNSVEEARQWLLDGAG